MKLTQKQLDQLHEYFAKLTDVDLVYLYGSFATGQTHPRSDIDLGVLFSEEIKPDQRLQKLCLELNQLKLPTMIQIEALSFDKSPVFLFDVIRGEEVFIRDENIRVNFEVQVMQQYYDT